MSKPICVRLEDDLAERLEAAAVEIGMDRSSYLRKLVVDAVGLPPKRHVDIYPPRRPTRLPPVVP